MPDKDAEFLREVRLASLRKDAYDHAERQGYKVGFITCAVLSLFAYALLVL